MIGFACSETIVCQDAVPSRESSVDIRVLGGVEADIPVAGVKACSMGRDLEKIFLMSILGDAELAMDVVSSRDGDVLNDPVRQWKTGSTVIVLAPAGCINVAINVLEVVDVIVSCCCHWDTFSDAAARAWQGSYRARKCCGLADMFGEQDEAHDS